MKYDLRYLVEALVAIVGLLVLLGLLLRLAGFRIEQALDRREWLLLGKIVAASGLLFLLLIRMLYLDLPEELFIYGRF